MHLNRPFYTVAETSTLLNRTHKRVYQLLKEGTLNRASEGELLGAGIDTSIIDYPNIWISSDAISSYMKTRKRRRHD